MSAEQLSSIVGVILSLAVAYIPGVDTWYDGLAAKSKAGIMAILLAVVSLSIFGLACAGLAGDFGLALVCDKASAIELVKIFVAALIANQSAFLLFVRKVK